MTAEYIPLIVNAALTLIVGILAKRIQIALDRAEKEKEKERRIWQGLREGMQVMLRSQLLDQYQAARRRGKISYDEADTFEALYAAYHNLGKNGVMDGVCESYREFPVVPESELYPVETDL